jgi:hypothetical protein
MVHLDKELSLAIYAAARKDKLKSMENRIMEN